MQFQLIKNRKGNPSLLTNRKLKKGDYFWQRKNNVYVSVWKDKRPVFTITTRNRPKLIQVSNRFGKLSTKPEKVASYNRYIGGIDHVDQMTSYYSSPRKTITWYKRVIFHLLDLTTWNDFMPNTYVGSFTTPMTSGITTDAQ